MTYTYNIKDFLWIEEVNTFYADSNKLFAMLEDGSMHQELFPNGKQQFYIANPDTMNRLRFIFVREEEVVNPFVEGRTEHSVLNKLIFQSEDGITCVIYK